MHVELLTYTPDADKIVAAAAKLCYSNSGIKELMDNLSPENTGSFLDMLVSFGHESPVEHASFTFGIEGVSRALLAQITRHRIASFSVQSQRYTDKAGFEYVIPPEIESIPEVREEFIKAMKEDMDHYENIRNLLIKKHYASFSAEGKTDKEARKLAEKKANEDARFVIPNACHTKIVMTMNVRSLYNFFKLRCCNRAQWEIKELANQMLFLCRDASPSLFKYAGPSCLYGKCGEGAYTCGKSEEIRRLLKK